MLEKRLIIKEKIENTLIILIFITIITMLLSFVYVYISRSLINLCTIIALTLLLLIVSIYFVIQIFNFLKYQIIKSRCYINRSNQLKYKKDK